MSEAARRSAERAARDSYGRLVALLAARTGGIAAAEDALAEAFAAALATWPTRGVPDRPEAWLLVAARRAAGHARARQATAVAGEATLALLADERAEAIGGDRRLELMFVCAHPAIEPAAQAPLMLQTVLGLDAKRIAAAFLVAPATMGQRLVRAKSKVRAAGIPFVIPEGAALNERAGRVLDAIYAAYGTAWEDVVGADAGARGLAGEALWLGRLVVELLPASAEAAGLLALMLHCEARRSSRRDADGRFVPLGAQDPRGWSHDAIVEAEALLRRAAASGVPGRYGTEAAIQSLHAEAAMTGRDLSAPLVALYDLLVSLHPSLGAITARAAAYGKAGRAHEGLVQLDAVAARCGSYQPWWVTRATLLRALGEDYGAARATAIGLTVDPDVRRFVAAG